VSKDWVEAVGYLRLADEHLRRSVEAVAKASWCLLQAVEQHGEAPFRERWGAEQFAERWSLATRYRELGEDRFKEVIFAEMKAELVGEPDRN
jgi:hypothetical protein